jgi:hypothetical protein
MENLIKNNIAKSENSIWNSLTANFKSVRNLQADTTIINELAIISCLIKNKRLTASNITKEIDAIHSKAYFD